MSNLTWHYLIFCRFHTLGKAPVNESSATWRIIATIFKYVLNMSWTRQTDSKLCFSLLYQFFFLTEQSNVKHGRSSPGCLCSFLLTLISHSFSLSCLLTPDTKTPYKVGIYGSMLQSERYVITSPVCRIFKTYAWHQTKLILWPADMRQIFQSG